MDVLTSFSKRPTRDPVARQAALTVLQEMRRGASYAGQMLATAQQANMDFAKTQSREALARRAVATRQAYTARMNAEVARQQAAFLILAEDAGNKAASTRDTMARVRDAQQQRVIAERVKVFEARRATLMQAAAAAAKGLQHIPPLPPELASGAPARQTNEVSVNVEMPGWRPRLYTERADLFFTDDVRRMASSLKGLGDGAEGTAPPADATGFWAAILRAVGQGAATVGQAAATEGQRVASADPTAAGAYQQAGGILTTLGRTLGVDLQAGQRGDVAPPVAAPSTSWTDYILPIAGGAAVLGLIVLLRR